MSDTDYKKLEKKFTDLEERVNAMGKIKPAKDKKPRKPSEYNIFMGKFMADDKKKNPDKDHAVRFKDAANAWGEKNKEKK
jgi:hypothetical protein